MKKKEFVTIDAAVKHINQKMKVGNIHLIFSGFSRLDELKQGWLKGELCVIGGRPTMGKTGFILSFISNLLIKNIPASLFSATDTLNESFLSRVLSILATKEQECGKEEVEIIKLSDLSKVPLFLNCQYKMTLNYIKENASSLVKDYSVKCIFIEDLQSIFYSEENGNSREGMELICHELKKLARELNVPIIITSDLNRAVERREGTWGKEPLLSDLSGSNGIENMADSVILLHRPEYYKIYQDEKGNSLRNIIEIKILKNRNRCIGGVTYKFNHIIGKVEEFKSMIPMPMPFKESNLIID